MVSRLESKYNIEYLCTDAYEAYSKYSISKKHTTTKAERHSLSPLINWLGIILLDSIAEQKDTAKLLIWLSILLRYFLINIMCQLLFSNAKFTH